MVDLTSIETKLDVISWYEGVGSFSLDCILLCEFYIFTLSFSVIKELPDWSGGFLMHFYSVPSRITETCFM